MLIAPVSVFVFLFPGFSYLGFRPLGEPYTATKFEFRYGHTTRFVDDPHNQMKWVYGDLPDSVTVTNGVRTIVYDKSSAIIKSSSDSMQADDDSFRHKGYMGIWSKGTHFSVDSSGVIQESGE